MTTPPERPSLRRFVAKHLAREPVPQDTVLRRVAEQVRFVTVSYFAPLGFLAQTGRWLAHRARQRLQGVLTSTVPTLDPPNGEPCHHARERPMGSTETPVETVGASNAVFLAVVCREVQPYLHYDQPITGPKDQRIPRVLLLLRWDNQVGFPGGFVDPGETLRQACVREALEEAGLRVTEDHLLPVCSHTTEDGFATHLYAIELDAAAFKQAVLAVYTAEHADAEVCGVLTPSIERMANGRGIDAFRRMPFAHNAGQQLDTLIERLGLLDRA